MGSCRCVQEQLFGILDQDAGYPKTHRGSCCRFRRESRNIYTLVVEAMLPFKADHSGLTF